MSSREFKEALESLRIPNFQVADASHYDWLFENERIVPFLAWFCDQVKFAKDAAALSRQTETSRIQDLGDVSLVECSHDVDTLLRLRDKCSIQQVELCGKKPYVNHVKERAQSDLMKKQELVKAVNKDMNVACNKLVTSVQDLCALYQLTGKDDRPTGAFGKSIRTHQGKVTFLSAVSSTDYFGLEEKFTVQLSEYTKKEFFDGVANLTGQQHSGEFQLLDLVQAKASVSNSRREEYEELEQANIVFPHAESKRVQAFVDSIATKSALQHSKRFSLPDLRADQSQIAAKLQAMIRHEQGKLELLHHDLIKLQDDEMPRLIKLCGDAMMSEFLQGDYDLKIKRQDFFYSKQNRVIEELLRQRARTELVTMCLAAEQREHSLNRKLVVAVCLFLQTLFDVHTKVEENLRGFNSTSQKYNKSTIDSRRKDLVELHEVLSIERTSADQKLFLTFDQLAEFAGQLRGELHQAQERDRRSQFAGQDRLSALIKNLNQEESVLFPAGNRAGGPQKLSLSQVSDASANLCDILDQLEKPALQLIRNVTQQSDALSSDQLTQVGRDLFVSFFTNSDKLRRTFKHL